MYNDQTSHKSIYSFLTDIHPHDIVEVVKCVVHTWYNRAIFSCGSETTKEEILKLINALYNILNDNILIIT